MTLKVKDTTLKAGDVIGGRYSKAGDKWTYTVLDVTPEYVYYTNGDGFDYYETIKHFEVISRASDNQEPKTWGEMTPEEKGELLLAHHEGEVIENMNQGMEWAECRPSWANSVYYRIKPEPKLEVVELFGTHGSEWYYDARNSKDTHRITYNIVNGEIDCTSIKMEKL